MMTAVPPGLVTGFERVSVPTPLPLMVFVDEGIVTLPAMAPFLSSTGMKKSPKATQLVQRLFVTLSRFPRP